MYNLCVLVSTYHPFHSANSKCIANIVEVLADKYSVTIIASGLNGEKAFNVKSVRVIPNPNARGATVMSRGLAFIRRLLHPNSVDIQVSNFFLDRLLRMEKKPDIIVPVCFPIESLHAAFRYKKSHEVAVAPYLLDVVSSSETAHTFEFIKKIKLRSNLAMERSLALRSSVIIVNEAWYEHLSRINALNDRVFLLGHPLVKNCRGNTVGLSKKGTFYYGGVLSRKLRDPSYFLQVIHRLLKDFPQYSLNICHRGDCAELLSSVLDSTPNAADYGAVDSDMATALMLKSQFLILIGNNDAVQLQSKVYEYISTGAPIIFFCKSKRDPILEVLSSYPKVLIISEDESIDEAVSNINTFAGEGGFDLISYDKVLDIYKENSVEYIADKYSIILRSMMGESISIDVDVK